MREVLRYFALWLAGAGLGVFFFGGLWWTVRRAVASRRAALWFAGSSLVRTAAALAGLYWCTGGDWKRLLACLLGFFVARVLVTRNVRSPLAVVRSLPEDCGSPRQAREKEAT